MIKDFPIRTSSIFNFLVANTIASFLIKNEVFATFLFQIADALALLITPNEAW
jgi:hypothetical protein